MAIYTTKSMIESYGVSWRIKDTSGNTTSDSVTIGSVNSVSVSRRPGEIFNVGGGSVYTSYPMYNYGFGSYVLIPDDNFIGRVDMWGGGGGGYHNSGGRTAGGGGYAHAWIDFMKDIPYTIVVGQAGQHDALTTHGGGGRGTSSGGGGSGGGLSGIFFNTDVTGTAVWNGTPTVSQTNALVIAGGGGGAGHHNASTHYGNAGGGGGWRGKAAHNSGGGGQTGGGAAGYSGAQAGFALHGGHSGQNTSWIGGGGGGWYGGGGGGHSGAHHNGGSGGSGHIAYDSSIAVQPNNTLAKFIRHGWLETSPSQIYLSDCRPGNFVNPLCVSDGRWAGMGGHGENNAGHATSHTATWGSRHGKVVISLIPEFMREFNFPRHTSVGESSGWSQTY